MHSYLKVNINEKWEKKKDIELKKKNAFLGFKVKKMDLGILIHSHCNPWSTLI